MNNSIDPRLNNGVYRLAEQPKPEQGTPGNGASRSQDPSTTSRVDTLDLTDKARSLKALEAQIKQSPEVDNKRVAELKQALKDGKYEINPARIADKLLSLDALLPK